MQQELMQKRKSGALIKEANERRKKVAETLEERKALRRAEKEALARGEMPDTLQNWKVGTATSGTALATASNPACSAPLGKSTHRPGSSCQASLQAASGSSC